MNIIKCSPSVNINAYWLGGVTRVGEYRQRTKAGTVTTLVTLRDTDEKATYVNRRG
jgi:hypothetical protein